MNVNSLHKTISDSKSLVRPSATNRNNDELSEKSAGHRNLRSAVAGAVSKMKIMSVLANVNDNVKDVRDELTLGQLPPEAERIKCDDVFKLCQGEWQPRILLMTANDLIIAYPGKNQISDKIPLVPSAPSPRTARP